MRGDAIQAFAGNSGRITLKLIHKDKSGIKCQGVGVEGMAEKLELVIPPGSASPGSHGLFSNIESDLGVRIHVPS